MARNIHDTIHQQLEDEEFKREWDSLELEYSLARAVLAARKEAGLTQQQLSEICGIAQADISRIEGATANPSLRTIKRLAEGLGKRVVVSVV